MAGRVTPPLSPGLLTSSKEQEHKEPLRAASPDILNAYSEVWAVALGEEWKADLYLESIHQRMCVQIGSVTAGCHSSVRAGAQPRLTLVTALDAARVCAVRTILAGWL